MVWIFTFNFVFTFFPLKIRWTRGCFARKFSSKLTSSQPVLKAALQKSTDLEEVTRAVEEVEGRVGSYNLLFPFKTKEWLACEGLKRRLTERKRVTEICQELLARDGDPEGWFDDLERGVEEARAIEGSEGTEEQLEVVKKTEELYKVACDRRECREELRSGTEKAERGTLERALERAVELGVKEEEEVVVKAKAMVERCKQEEGICDELRGVLGRGGVLVWGGEGGQEGIETGGLKETGEKATTFGMKTAVGTQLLRLCGYLEKLRGALKGVGEWGGVSEWEEVGKLLDNPPISEEEEDLVSFMKHPEVFNFFPCPSLQLISHPSFPSARSVGPQMKWLSEREGEKYTSLWRRGSIPLMRVFWGNICCILILPLFMLEEKIKSKG